MRTFVQKQKAAQRTTSAKLAIPVRAHFGHNHEVISILHLQRTIGNQAVQRLLQRHAEESNTVLTGTTSPRFGHDFGRIPVTAGPIHMKLAMNKPGDEYEREADRVAEQVMRIPEPQLQRACACGGPCPEWKVEQLSQERERLQTKRVRASGTEPVAAPPIVHKVLQSPGQSIDAPTRRFMESRFGHDFSGVRVHADVLAAQSAADVEARAYTVGQHLVFGTGQYVPGTNAGKRLIAHELAHVVQQEATSPGPTRTLARQRTPNTIDARAQALIDLAQDTSIAIDQRAQRLVTQILATYYPSDASKFTQINWDETDPGVTAVCASTGTPTMTCTIKVGRYFVENTTRSGIARRVLQIGHEIQHVNQHRQRMGGGTRRHEREFLAFHWEATAPEAAGTGRMQHATRVALIDAAIKHYNCFTAAEKTTYNTQYQQLLTLRQSEQTASGNPATPVPTQCSD